MYSAPIMTRVGRFLPCSCLAAPFILTGCVERTIHVTSEPPGAIVWLNDVEIGRTPVETEFTFYGNYDVRLRLEGYEPIASNREAKAPVYDWPGIDLLAEAAPMRIDSNVNWHFVLTPMPEKAEGVDRDAVQRDLIERARDTRGQLGPDPAEQPEK